MTLADRRITLEACFNFRDLGGHRAVGGRTVRAGMLYRADTLHRLSGGDLEVLRGLGLRTVVDLRTHDELDRFGRVGLSDDEVSHRHIPVFDELRTGDAAPDPDAPAPGLRGELYVRMVETGGKAFAEAITLLAQPGALPAVFHCTAGKDRTGVLAALVLGHLGVPDDDIAADYALTEEAMALTRAWVKVHDLELASHYATFPDWVFEARAETMQAFLAAIRAEHGSVTGLIETLGVAPATLASLASSLLDP
jgi:protein-tyrosine phosphatase